MPVKPDDDTAGSSQTTEPQIAPDPAVGAIAGFEAAPDGYTLDAFHRGGFYLLQPSAGGHRAGMDAMLLAATVPEVASGSLADLGAGAGAAGLAVANRISDLEVLLVERAPPMVDCARRTLSLAQNAHLAARVQVLEADVNLQGTARRAAGLVDRIHDYVILNPPFNSGRDRKTPDRLKAEAHVMESPDLFEMWLRTACAILKPGGQVSIIARPEALGDVLGGLAGRFGGVEVTPVCARAETDAIRILVTAIKGSRARMILRDRILLHEGRGREFTSLADDLVNGRGSWPRGSKTRAAR
jgi:tRNA1(Val) A37 N6-methylase TrmN6